MTRTQAKVQHTFSTFSILLLILMLLTSLLLAAPARAQTDQGVVTGQTAGDSPATVGQPYTFTATVTNNSVPQHVGLKDFLSPGMELVSATPSQGSCGMSHHDINGVECDLGELSSGDSATVEFVVTPTEEGTMTNTVVGGGEFTPETSDKAAITVNPA